MKSDYAKYLLEETKKDYSLIAEDYARTRAFIPEDIKALGEYSLEGERVLDSGCANGRLFGVLEVKKVDYYGIDISERLIDIAKKNYPRAKFQVADALNLPFPDNFFDKIYSISVLHNVPSRELRLRYLKEARRILRPEGLLIIRVWDFWKRKAAPKLLIKYSFLKIIAGFARYITFGAIKKSQLDFKDVFVPWKTSEGKILIQRYFHCFTKKELEKLTKEAGLKIKKSWRAGDDPRTNIYLIAEK